MEDGVASKIFILSLLFLLTIPLLSTSNGEVESPTLISGKVTDSETGKPIPGVFVAVINRSKDLHFYYNTDEDGSFSVNVGTSGVFIVAAITTSHEELFKEVEIGIFDQLVVDLQLVRNEHNVRIHFYSWDEEFPLFALDVGITDSTGNETRYLTNEDGWLKLWLNDGNYTVRSYRDFLETYEDNFTISENKAFFDIANLHPVNVNGSASLIVFHDNLYIPPNEYKAIVIEDEEPTAMWLHFKSDIRISVQTMTEEMYLSYLETLAGIPFNDDEPPHIPYDSKIVTRGGGGTVIVWQLPYYILLANNGTESALVSVDLRYEYGSPIVSEVIGGSLEPRSADQGPKDLSISSIYLLLFLVIVLVLIYSLFRSHRDRV